MMPYKLTLRTVITHASVKVALPATPLAQPSKAKVTVDPQLNPLRPTTPQPLKTTLSLPNSPTRLGRSSKSSNPVQVIYK